MEHNVFISIRFADNLVVLFIHRGQLLLNQHLSSLGGEPTLNYPNDIMSVQSKDKNLFSDDSPHVNRVTFKDSEGYGQWFKALLLALLLEGRRMKL
jgi:hypothetical protein